MLILLMHARHLQQQVPSSDTAAPRPSIGSIASSSSSSSQHPMLASMNERRRLMQDVEEAREAALRSAMAAGAETALYVQRNGGRSTAAVAAAEEQQEAVFAVLQRSKTPGLPVSPPPLCFIYTDTGLPILFLLPVCRCEHYHSPSILELSCNFFSLAARPLAPLKQDAAQSSSRRSPRRTPG